MRVSDSNSQGVPSLPALTEEVAGLKNKPMHPAADAFRGEGAETGLAG
jgi:hypothetical protein